MERSDTQDLTNFSDLRRVGGDDAVLLVEREAFAANDAAHSYVVGVRRLVKILVVDDSRVMREMIVASLRALEGIEFTHAASGLEAIERLSLSSFDLVFLDLNMPDISGFEVVEFVRSQDALRALPIVVVTTRGDEGSRAQAMAAGASRFLTKPFAPESIVAEVRSLVGDRLRPPQ